MNKSDSIIEISKALNKLQGEMPFVPMNKTNPFFNSRYADLGSVIETSKPLMTKNGLSMVQSPIGSVENGVPMVGVDTILMHTSGEWIQSTVSVPLDSQVQEPSESEGGQAKKKKQGGATYAQKAGIIISYFRRYSWISLLGLYADEDSDGNEGVDYSFIKSEISTLITANVDNKDVIKKYREVFSKYGTTDPNKIANANLVDVLAEMKKVQ